MKWTVVNAQSRDVERQHLNKILKEIESSYTLVNDRVNQTNNNLGNVQNGLTTTITKVINNVLPAGDLATQVTLTGAVTGVSVKVPGQNAVTINTSLSEDFVTEAPIDNNRYWRYQGNWELVPPAVVNLGNMPGTGYVVITSAGLYQNRTIVSADDTRIVVLNGDGDLDNTSIDLAEVPDDGTGILQRTSFDEYGRKTGTADATTDDLEEGVTNLYFTDERAQDSVGNILVDTPTIVFTYDDTTPGISADISDEYQELIEESVRPSNVPTDGDILEYDGVGDQWVAKKNPRELLIDGGNF